MKKLFFFILISILTASTFMKLCNASVSSVIGSKSVTSSVSDGKNSITALTEQRATTPDAHITSLSISKALKEGALRSAGADITKKYDGNGVSLAHGRMDAVEATDVETLQSQEMSGHLKDPGSSLSPLQETTSTSHSSPGAEGLRSHSHRASVTPPTPNKTVTMHPTPQQLPPPPQQQPQQQQHSYISVMVHVFMGVAFAYVLVSVATYRKAPPPTATSEGYTEIQQRDRERESEEPDYDNDMDSVSGAWSGDGSRMLLLSRQQANSRTPGKYQEE